MFNRKPAETPHALDETIASLISEIQESVSGSEQHTTMVSSLKTLMELRNADIATAKPATITPDAIVTVAGNLLGIGLILGFEKAHVITSKSLSFVPKVKI